LCALNYLSLFQISEAGAFINLMEESLKPALQEYLHA